MINIMDALKQSLDQMKKKPAQSAPVEAQAPTKKVASGNGKRLQRKATAESS